MRNVTPQPRVGTRSAAPPRARTNQTFVLVLAIVALILLARACFPGENRYERIARGVTTALQNNDLAAVQRYENAETAAEMSRVRVAQAADAFAALGKIRRVREATPKGDPPRVHEFTVQFANGTVHERMQVDPQDKVVHFHYDAPQRSR
jgi:hypothetical protein